MDSRMLRRSQALLCLLLGTCSAFVPATKQPGLTHETRFQQALRTMPRRVALSPSGLSGDTGRLSTTRRRTITYDKPTSGDTGKQCEHHKIVIIGGGTAGISVAAQLRNEGVEDICIVEPSPLHYYQPMWTLVGGGVFPLEASRRPTASLIPEGCQWMQNRITELFPEENRLRTDSGQSLSYDYLVVAAGLQCDWSAIPGLQEGLGHNGVCSNYHPQHAQYTWQAIQQLKGGRALFTQPNTPVKCGGAPQKIMWLTEDYLRRTGHRGEVEVTFALPQNQIFGVKQYADTLVGLAAKRDVDVRYGHKLVRIDAEKQQAFLQPLSGGPEVCLSFSLLHVTPPMSSPDFLKTSPLANDCGFVAVDKETLQSCKFSNVFALGDCSSLPTSKTMAAITAQAPVLVHNLLRLLSHRRPSARYNGYTSCPIVLGYNSLLLTEFLYDGKVSESFSRLLPLPFLDQSKPSWVYLQVKKYVFPFAYWHLLMKGHWFGPKLIFKPDFSAEDAAVDAQDGLAPQNP